MACSLRPRRPTRRLKVDPQPLCGSVSLYPTHFFTPCMCFCSSFSASFSFCALPAASPPFHFAFFLLSNLLLCQPRPFLPLFQSRHLSSTLRTLSRVTSTFHYAGTLFASHRLLPLFLFPPPTPLSRGASFYSSFSGLQATSAKIPAHFLSPTSTLPIAIHALLHPCHQKLTNLPLSRTTF